MNSIDIDLKIKWYLSLSINSISEYQSLTEEATINIKHQPITVTNDLSWIDRQILYIYIYNKGVLKVRA